MTDVTAQAFREAATELYLVPIKDLERLLLAAVEQREQLDWARTRVNELEAQDRRRFDVILHQERQIATLTAERDEARAQLVKLQTCTCSIDAYDYGCPKHGD
jgi:hypothetical protein